MAALRNHHYVPQFYFRRFSIDQRSICLLTRSNGRAVPRAPIKGQASKIGYYGDEDVERTLAEIEGECAAAFRRLDDVRTPRLLNDDDVTLVLIHVTLQRTRTETHRQASKAFHDQVTRLMLEAELSNTEHIAASDRELLLGSLEHVEADPIAAQRMQMGIAIEQSARLQTLKPLVLVNKTNRPFIFGDAPVVFYNGFYREVRHRGVLGLDTPGLMVFFPLNADSCLALLDPDCYQVRGEREGRVQVRDLRDVLALNQLQIHAAANCVYFGDFRFAPYVAEAWRQERGRLTKHEGMVIEAPGRDAITGDSLGDIVHGFQPQLTYPLRLTFLKHEVHGDDSYAFTRRSQRD